MLYDYWYKICVCDGIKEQRAKELKTPVSHQNVCIEEIYMKIASLKF